MNLCTENLKVHQVDLRIIGNQDLEFDCRPTQISQVLVSLINNSLDATRDLPEKWIEIQMEDQNGKIRITVTDSGNGIPEGIANKIMNPFFTTKEIGKGTGLGLSISKGIIENHGGTITLNTASPHTQFIIELPIQQNVSVSAHQKIA